MATASQVAKFLLQMGYCESCPEESDFLCNMRLQKLLYYVQGWSLALRDKPMFNDEIQAWIHGPVVPSVYREYQGSGANSIQPPNINPVDQLSPEDQEFVQTIWEGYKGFSANKLRQMTHVERPWIEAREGFLPSDHSQNSIWQSKLARYFKEVAKEKYPDALDAWEGERDFQLGIAIPLDNFASK